MATHTPSLPQTESNTDFLPLKGTDHVEFYVGNARQAAYFYRTAFGMSLVAYAGPETAQRGLRQLRSPAGEGTLLFSPQRCAQTRRSPGTSTNTGMVSMPLLSGWTMPDNRGLRPPGAARAAFRSPKSSPTAMAQW